MNENNLSVVNNSDDDNTINLLIKAAENGDLKTVQQAILNKNVNINKTNSFGNTMLMVVVAAEKLIKKTWVTKIINFFSNIKKWLVGTVVTSEQNKSPINIKSSILTPENSDLIPKLVDCQEKWNNENKFVEKQIVNQVNALDNLSNNKILSIQSSTMS